MPGGEQSDLTGRAFQRELVIEALQRGDHDLAAKFSHRLASLRPPLAADLVLAGLCRLQIQDRYGAGALFRRALAADPLSILAAKAMAKFGSFTPDVLTALRWHAESDEEARKLLSRYVADTGQAVTFIAERAVQCYVGPEAAELSLRWHGLNLASVSVPAAFETVRLYHLSIPEPLRGVASPQVFSGDKSLDDVIPARLLQVPRLKGRVEKNREGQWLVQAIDLAAPERPLSLILLDGDRPVRRMVTDLSQQVAESVDQIKPLLLPSLSGLENPRLLFELTGEPLPWPFAGHGAYEVASDRTIDVIVPVYGDAHATHACLSALFEYEPGWPMRVIIIDDASQDPEISVLIDSVAIQNKAVVYRNKYNLGFVRSVNIGMSASTAHDVVLLNADTIVTPNWLARLHAAAQPGVGTVTPLSNDASICSYPKANDRTPLEQVDVFLVDRLAKSTFVGETVDIPTAVGFCMYITRECLRQVGWFDTDHFGRGYGEENDFCLRATALGWRHSLALDTYIGHVGGGSFGFEKRSRMKEAQRVINILYPDYEERVLEFINSDPVLPARRKLDLALLSQNGAWPLLIICPNLGGGTERFIKNLIMRRQERGEATLLLRPESPETEHEEISAGEQYQPRPASRLRIEVPGRPNFSNLIFRLPDELPELLKALNSLGVQQVELHHPYRLTPEQLAFMVGSMPYGVQIHDYGWICPRLHLIGSSGRYCEEPDTARCEQCVAANGAHLEVGKSVSGWRTAMVDLLTNAQHVGCASADVMRRIRRYVPAAHLVSVPVEDPLPVVPMRWPEKKAGEPWRIVVPGGVGTAKGYDLLLECVHDAYTRSLPLSFQLLGYSRDDDELLRAGIEVITGWYEEENVASLLAELKPHGAFLSSVCPETWCFTLSHMMLAGLSIAALDFGAQAERLRNRSGSLLMKYTLKGSEINDALLEWLHFLEGRYSA